jgi:hypothetical protein
VPSTPPEAAARVSDQDVISPSIVLVAAPLDQSVALQRVQKRDEQAVVDVEDLAELALTDQALLSEDVADVDLPQRMG